MAPFEQLCRRVGRPRRSCARQLTLRARLTRLRRGRVPRPGLSGLEVGRFAQGLTNEPPITMTRPFCALCPERHWRASYRLTSRTPGKHGSTRPRRNAGTPDQEIDHQFNRSKDRSPHHHVTKSSDAELGIIDSGVTNAPFARMTDREALVRAPAVMTDPIAPAERFQAVRGRLFGLAYRMVGSRADAEDLVQEAYLRWHAADHERIESAEAWLVTTTSRLALDCLRRLKTERDAYTGPWLPEPILGAGAASAPAPDQHLDLADDLSMAFLTLLERLAPEERAAFLLHDVFEVDYRAIASVIGRSEAATRQVVHRARERVRGERRRFETTEAARTVLLERFLAAVEARDEQALLELFAPDASWTADGGGKTAAAARPVLGADRIAKLVIGLRENFWGVGRRFEIAVVNGEAGLLLLDGERLIATISMATDGQQIQAVYAVVNPDKLT